MPKHTEELNSIDHQSNKPTKTQTTDPELIEIAKNIRRNQSSQRFYNNPRELEEFFGKERAEQIIAGSIEDGFKIRPPRNESFAARREQIDKYKPETDILEGPLPPPKVKFQDKVEVISYDPNDPTIPSIEAAPDQNETALPRLDMNFIIEEKPNPFKIPDTKYQDLIRNQKTSNDKGRVA